MVKGGKKTTTSENNKKGKENPEIFILMRDIVAGDHHVVPRNQIITSKKLQKLEPGDEIGFGARGARIRGTVLLIGSEGQCKSSLVTIEKAKRSTNKTTKKKEKNMLENENESDRENDVEENNNPDSNESEDLESSDGEDVDLGNENHTLEANEDRSSKDVVRSNSFDCSPSAVPIKCFSIFMQSCSYVFLEGAESVVVIQKRKSLSDVDNESSSKFHRGSYGKTVPTSLHVMLERKASALEAQILEYQTSWMPRPTDPTTINYLIDIGKILSSETGIDPDEKSDILFEVLKALNVTEKQLQDCIGKNIRITVRQIMKMKYPNPPTGFKFADVDRNHVAAARDYARLMHSREEKMYTDGDLNHSMGNVFASKNHHKNNVKASHD